MNAAQILQFLAIVLTSGIAGVMNAIAGGGTLLTFPALISLGVSPIVANGTSTAALWPGAISSMWGYRDELSGSRRWALGFAAPSLLGGAVGAWLLLRTPPSRFAALVPWLVLSATALFMLQPAVVRAIRRGQSSELDDDSRPLSAIDHTATGDLPSVSILVWQFFVGIYGGYFGAGVGILTLAGLGFMGMTNIHRMNGLKNWGGLCMNAIAAVMFAFTSVVNWPIALTMAAGSIAGGYVGARAAQRTPQKYVRRAVIAIGLAGGFWLLLHRHS